MGKEYKINEIFYSLQAEGSYCGTPSVFIRLSGCNLKCPWCDTKKHIYGDLLTKKEISEKIDDCLKGIERNKINLVLTGGEPTLQLHNEEQIADGFKKICIETNGTMPVPSWVNFVTCSPKQDILFENFPTRPSEIKVVYETSRDKYLIQLISTVPEDVKLYLQPLEYNGKYNYAETISFIKKYPRFRLSLQYHKIIGIR